MGVGCVRQGLLVDNILVRAEHLCADALLSLPTTDLKVVAGGGMAMHLVIKSLDAKKPGACSRGPCP